VIQCYVYHQVHSPGMEGVGEVLEIGFGTEFGIELGRVGSPVSL
jgi:hypothetical protein